MCRIDIKASCKTCNTGGAQIRLSLFPVNQVIQYAVAQCALRCLHLFNAQQVKHSAQHTDTATNHGPAVFFHAVNFQAICTLGFDQAIQQPVESGLTDKTSWPVTRCQHVTDSANRARRPVSHVPRAGLVGIDSFVQYGLGGHFGRLESAQSELPVCKVLHRPGHAAHPVRLHVQGIQTIADDHFRRSSANVHDQPTFVRLRQHVRHALVNQPGFFTARNHVNRKAENFVRSVQKFIAVAGFAQGLGGDCPDLALFKARQPFAKTSQTVPAALHRVKREVAVRVQPIALTDGFFEVFGAVDLASVKAANLKAKAIGS